MLKILCFFFTFLMMISLAAQDKVKESNVETLEITGTELIIRFQKLMSNDQQRLIQMKSRSKHLER